jgi:uncharacterized protein
MLIPDVNVLVYAFRPYDAHSERCREWLEKEVDKDEPFGLSELVLSGFLRVVTNPRAFGDPAQTAAATSFVDWLLDQPNSTVVQPHSRRWAIFLELCRLPDVKGNLVADAYHAALAIESNSTWITFDGDYARFPNLSWRRPF